METGVVVGTSVELEDLIVSVAWSGSVGADWFEIVVFDEHNLQIAGQLVLSRPSEQGEATFEHFLQNVPEGGFQFSTTVRDAAGRNVAQPHAFRVGLECADPVAPCQWRTQDGLDTDALATSEPLLTALDALAAGHSSNLLADALKQQPGLRGSVYSLAAQIDRLDKQVDLRSGCVCVWHHASDQWPKGKQCGRSGPGQQADGSGSEKGKREGRGANAYVTGQARRDQMFHAATATGMSRQTMTLHCWKVLGWTPAAPLPLPQSPGMAPATIRFPAIEACPGACQGTIESSSTVGYRVATRVRESSSGASHFSSTAVDAFFEKAGGSSQPPEEETWGTSLQWMPGETDAAKKGTIRLPVGGPFVDNDTRRMTTTLSVKAAAEWQAEDTWSYAEASVYGMQLWTRGYAACALSPIGTAELRIASDDGPRSDDCGEVYIEPWEY